jgi:excisionase family DNA binding protein
MGEGESGMADGGEMSLAASLGRVLSIKQVAAETTLSESTVERAIRSRELESTKIGRRRLTTDSWVRTWILRRAGGAAAVVLLVLVLTCAAGHLGLEAAADVMQAIRCPLAPHPGRRMIDDRIDDLLNPEAAGYSFLTHA